MDIKKPEKVKLMMKEWYKRDWSDTKMWEELREEGISISRPKVSRIRRTIGPPKHRPYGPSSGLTDKQYEWWSTQKDRPQLMKRMVEYMMTLDPEQLEIFKLGKIQITTSTS